MNTLEYFHKAWGTFKNGQYPPIFPGPQPVSVERRHFQTLKNGTYVVCEKTDGVRHALIIHDGRAHLINRALELTPVSLKFPKKAYKGTILDGELVDGNLFMVYDTIMVYGVDLKSKNLLDRLELAERIVSAIEITKRDTLTIKMKKFFPLEDFQVFKDEYLPSLSYPTDGLVFTPVMEPIRIGTHETMFKWKPRDKNTVDFQLKRRSPDKWSLYIQEKGVLVFESELPHKDHEWYHEDAILECQYMINDTPIWWKPVGIRKDKNHPNNRRTFYRTMVNVREDIKIDEFNF